jgi:hypothetical protein
MNCGAQKVLRGLGSYYQLNLGLVLVTCSLSERPPTIHNDFDLYQQSSHHVTGFAPYQPKPSPPFLSGSE